MGLLELSLVAASQVCILPEGSVEDRVEGTGEEPLESGMVGVAIAKGKVTGKRAILDGIKVEGVASEESFGDLGEGVGVIIIEAISSQDSFRDLIGEVGELEAFTD